MIEQIEPNWCYEGEKEDIFNEEEYEAYMADIIYEERMLGLIE